MNIHMVYYRILILLTLNTMVLSCTTIKNAERPLLDNVIDGIFFESTDGTKIFYSIFMPNNIPRTTIYIISGYTGINHEKDRDIIEILGNETNRVVTIHPRGTGYSEGIRGGIRNFNLFVNDYVEIINNDIRMNHENKVILYGHSIGGAFALDIGTKIEKIDGMILVNPPYKMKASPGMTPSISEYIKYGFYMVFARHAPIVNMGGDPSLISNDQERAEAIERANDPLVVRYISMYMMVQSRKYLENMLNLANDAEYPLILIYGAEDSVIEKEGCDEIYENWKFTKKEYQIIENGPHGKQTVILARNKIKDWINNI